MKKILIDTSIWIEYFRGNSKVVALIHNNEDYAVHISGPIITELILGIKTEGEKEQFITAISVLPNLPITDDDWVEVGILGNALRKAGKTMPMADLLVFNLARKHKCALYTLDRHFQTIADITGHELEIL